MSNKELQKIKKQREAIDAEIDAMRSRHEAELRPLYDRANAVMLEELKIATGLQVGSIFKSEHHNGQVCKIVDVEFNSWSAQWVFCIYKKDKTLGEKRYKLYYYSDNALKLSDAEKAEYK